MGFTLPAASMWETRQLFSGPIQPVGKVAAGIAPSDCQSGDLTGLSEADRALFAMLRHPSVEPSDGVVKGIYTGKREDLLVSEIAIGVDQLTADSVKIRTSKGVHGLSPQRWIGKPERQRNANKATAITEESRRHAVRCRKHKKRSAQGENSLDKFETGHRDAEALEEGSSQADVDLGCRRC